MARNPEADYSDVDLNAGSRAQMAALLAQTARVNNPSLGGNILNGLAMGLLGMFEKQDREKAEGKKAAGWSAISDMVAPSGQTPSVAPLINPTAARSSVDENAVGNTPQERINNAFGATPQAREIATRTVLGEAGNQSPAGMNAVADVMRNRAAAGGYGGNTLDAVALAKGQFEPWMTQAGRARMQSYSPQGQPYQQAQAAVDSAGVGYRRDDTGGATHFYAPQAQAQLAQVDGRPVVPSFAAGRQPTAQIEGHNFYPPPQRTAQAPSQGPQAVEQVLQKVLRDPNIPDAFKEQALQLYQQQYGRREPVKMGADDRLVDPRTGREVVPPSQAGGKPPSGYEWAQGPNGRELRAIEGGPATHLPAETAGRLAMMQTAIQDLPKAREVFMRDWGKKEVMQEAAARAGIGAASGDVGLARRTVRTTIEAALRAMTGAAAPDSEVKRYEDMFMPSSADDKASAKQKLDLLESFVGNANRTITQGRGGPVQPQGARPQGGAILDEALDAIKRGAPRDAVIKRLRERGVEVPAGF